ncbi:DUF4192 domain-containing protein [Streptomyces sp. NPDC051907]|uniref:DUF4192 domain-containing protein n=1 Tax=Streptomyces sp. NPDC051907 TaxID=3155284 RepID=UPI00342AF871
MPFPDWTAVRLSTPADYAEAMPYLIGYRPRQSVVVAAFHGDRCTVAARLGLPAAESAWLDYAAAGARKVVAQLDAAPDAVVLYLVGDPRPGEDGRTVAARLAPLAGMLAAAFARHAVAVRLALCISDGRWWDLDTAPGPGTVLSETAPGPAAVAFTVAGAPPAPAQDALTATLAPLTGMEADSLRAALHDAYATRAPSTARPAAHALLEDAAAAFADPAATALPARDAAALLLALSDGAVRYWAMSLPDTHTNSAARRLFAYLATAAVHPHESLACAPLTLLAASAWYDDDRALARLALHRACRVDPAAPLPGLLLAAFNLFVSTRELKDMARAGRPG